MSAANNFRLGLFILGAIATLIIILIVMGTGNLLRPTTAIETYIDGSVQGLDVGAPIKFRGVTIGDVTRLGFTAVEYQADVSPTDRKRYVMVEGRVRLERFAPRGRSSSLFGSDPEPQLQVLIDNGLRVRMAAQGITGINYLELDFLDPVSHPPLPISWEPRSIHIPSAPSIAVQFLENAEAALRRFSQLDIEAVIDGATLLLFTLEQKASDLDIQGLQQIAGDLTTEIGNALVQGQQLMAAAEALVASPETRALPAETQATLQTLRSTLERADLAGLVQQIEAVVARLDRGLAANEEKLTGTLGDLQAATSALRSLTEDARRNPAGTIFGAPPPRSTLERSP
jgi:paraquat-inducible protein B